MSTITPTNVSPQFVTPTTAPNHSSPPPSGSKCWNGVKVAWRGFCEIVCGIALYVLAGLASLLIWPSMSVALFVYAGTMAVTRIVIKIIDPYNCGCTRKIKEKANNLVTRCPRLELIALLVTIALSAVYWVLGFLALPIGLLSGTMMGLRINEREIETDKRRLINSDDRPIPV